MAVRYAIFKAFQSCNLLVIVTAIATIASRLRRFEERRASGSASQAQTLQFPIPPAVTPCLRADCVLSKPRGQTPIIDTAIVHPLLTACQRSGGAYRLFAARVATDHGITNFQDALLPSHLGRLMYPP